MRHVVRVVVLAMVAGLAAVLGASPAQAAEIVIIDQIKVGTPVMQTKDNCRGYMRHQDPVVPMTVVATFIPPPGQEPTGPYATGMWDGGFGSWDNHFGTAQGKAHTQFFHILLRSNRMNGYRGAGYYNVTSIVQDVGLAGGFAEKTVNVYIPPPSPGGAKVKCTMTQPLGPQYVLDQIKDAAIDQLRDHFCPVCGPIKDALSTLQTYSEILDHYTYRAIADDPPDPDYQQIAAPEPPPVLAPPAGLTAAQAAAWSRLVASYAKNIGLAKALLTTVNRLWGANNAASGYWYDRQMRAIADLAGQQAAALDELPALWSALATSMADDLGDLDISVDGQDVATNLARYVDGLPSEHATRATALGEDSAAQRDMADKIVTYANLDEVEPTSLMTALFDTNAADVASSFRTMRSWAESALEEARPVVSEVTPNRGPASGGNLVTVKGLNLQSVSGINFGPSTTSTGQGDILSCSDDECSVYAPPGRGTVDVVAIGPGGPSAVRPSTKYTYADGVPAVTGVFPSSGRLAGGNEVTIFGTGLEGGTPYFGPSMAGSWICFEDRCRAWPQSSVNPATVDVTVKTDAGRSPPVAGARYTFTDAAKPPPAAPSVTSLSPDTGSDVGGDRVRITGTGFEGATRVRFGGDWGRDGTDLVVLSDTQLEVTTPSREKGAAEVLVYGPGGVSAPATFTYVDEPPVITSVTPSSGPNIGGTQVTVRGTGLNGASIDIGDAFVRDEVCTATRCTFTTPPVSSGDPATGPLPVTIWTSNGRTTPETSGTFTYTDSPDPVVTEVVADTGTKYGGAKVVVMGENLGGGTVTFGGVKAPVQDFPEWCSMQSCIVRTPPHEAGPVSVVVTTPGGRSVPDGRATFSYVRPAEPVVTSVTPSSGLLNSVDDVTIHGHNLEGGTVWFGDVEATPRWGCTASECELDYPPVGEDGRTPGVVDVRVETPAGISDVTAATKYEFVVPTITSISPTSGWSDGEQEVTVTGKGLKGARMLFGGRQSATEECEEDTTCTVLAPRTTTLGPVDVQVAADGGSTRSVPGPESQFTYVARPAPTVTGISPTSGTTAGGDLVTLDGTDLLNAQVTVGGSSVTEECTNTRCTFTTPARAAGAQPVQVRTTAGTTPAETAPTYTYAIPPAPTITSVTPDRGSTLGGTRVTVTGTDLVGAQITFGQSAGADEKCTRTTCTVVTPKRAVGPVAVGATTVGGSSAGSTTYTYELPPVPVVTGVSPDSGPATGGQKVTITGEHLAGATIKFGATAVPVNQATCTATECTAVQPAGSAGPVQVTATTEGRTSTASATFTYTGLRVDPVAMPGTDPTALGGGVVTPGLGGDLWFTAPKRDEVGRVHADGTVTTFPTADESEPLGITRGPDDRMWFTEKRTNRIVAMTADGTQEAFALPGTVGEGAYDLRHITLGPDGRLWFTLATSGVIGAMTTSGQFELFHLDDPYVVPYHLRAGPDGRIWFTEWGGQAVGAITVDGEITEYRLPGERGVSWDIVEGLDGKMWFTQAVGRTLVGVDAGGRTETHELPPRAANPQGLTVGPDGRLWFVAPDVDQLGAYDTDTRELTTYPLPPGPIRGPKYLAMDGRGDLWVNTLSSAALFRVSGLPGGSPTVTHLSHRYGAAGDEVVVRGAHLGGATSVTVGGADAAFTVVDPAQLRLTVPTGTGTVAVRVTTPAGTSPTGPSATFTYGQAPAPQPVVTSVSPAFGTVGGGTAVTVTGRNLAGGTVHFDGTAASGSCTATQCSVTAPAHVAGTVDLSVTTPGGRSESGEHARFTYQEPPPAAPTLTGLSPAKGPNTGGTLVTITGTQLAGGQVVFGNRSVPSSCTATRCTATSPPAGAGPSTVRVSTPGGTTPVSDASTFTYEPTDPIESVSRVLLDRPSKVYGQYLNVETRVIPAEAVGTMVLKSGSTVVGSGALKDGSVRISLEHLAVGTHQLRAHYSGSAEHAPSVSEPVTFTVTPGDPDSPAAPSDVVATAGDRSATVTWTAPGDNGSPITGYTVTSAPGGKTVTVGGDTTEALVTGLTNGTEYTFTVKATNALGVSPASQVSNAVTPAGVPAKMSAPKVVVRGSKAVVKWKAADDNGAPVTQYRIDVKKGTKRDKTVPGGKLKAVLKKLPPGRYRVRVGADNAVGSGPFSKWTKFRIR